MHTLTTQETIRKLTHYHVQNDVESDVRQETKVTSDHTSTHAQHKLYMQFYKYNSPTANVGNGRSKWIRGETTY